MNKGIKDIISLTKSQRKALFIVMVALVSIHLYNFSIQAQLDKQESYTSLSSLLEKISPDSTLNSNIDLRPTNNQYDKNDRLELPDTIQKTVQEIQFFDPNKVDSLELIIFGLKPFVIKNMLNYRRKGGWFKHCSELKKIYGMDSLSLNYLISYCKCEQTKKPQIPYAAKAKEQKLININTADSIELKFLYGIGPVLASRIIKYRSNIGGFYNLNQLTEVYGVEQEILEKNASKLTVGGSLTKININEAKYNDFYKHYYFDRKISNIIIKYRSQHGRFDSIEQLKNIKILSDSLFHKFKPYLKIT